VPASTRNYSICTFPFETLYEESQIGEESQVGEKSQIGEESQTVVSQAVASQAVVSPPKAVVILTV